MISNLDVDLVNVPMDLVNKPDSMIDEILFIVRRILTEIVSIF